MPQSTLWQKPRPASHTRLGSVPTADPILLARICPCPHTWQQRHLARPSSQEGSPRLQTSCDSSRRIPIPSELPATRLCQFCPVQEPTLSWALFVCIFGGQ